MEFCPEINQFNKTTIDLDSKDFTFVTDFLCSSNETKIHESIYRTNFDRDACRVSESRAYFEKNVLLPSLNHQLDLQIWKEMLDHPYPPNLAAYPSESTDFYYSGPARIRLRKPGFAAYGRISDENKCGETFDEILVPVRIEFEIGEGQMFFDNFTWNLLENEISPEEFSRIMCEDYDLDQSYSKIISQQIYDHINDFKKYAPNICAKRDLFSKLRILEDEKINFYLDMVKKRGTDMDFVKKSLYSSIELECYLTIYRWLQIRAKSNLSAEISLQFPGELRTFIELDILVNDTNLQYTVEVDLYSLSSSDRSVEKIAKCICQDLKLDGEFLTSICFQIRYQAWRYIKSLICIGHAADGGPILDSTISSWFLPAIDKTSVRRVSFEGFNNKLKEISSTKEKKFPPKLKCFNNRRYVKTLSRGRRSLANVPVDITGFQVQSQPDDGILSLGSKIEIDAFSIPDDIQAPILVSRSRLNGAKIFRKRNYPNTLTNEKSKRLAGIEAIEKKPYIRNINRE